MKREAGGQGEFSVGRIFGAATPPRARQDFWRSHAPGAAGFLAQPRPPGRGRIFGAATPPGALVHVKKVTVLNVFCAPRPSMP